jgi:polyhydroxyalkanoate synthesis regulator phasin
MSQSFLTARRGLAAGGAVLLLAGSAVGIAAAQTAPTTTPATGAAAGQAQPGYQAFIDALAKRLGISSATLQTAVGQARADAGLPAGGGFGPGHGRPGGPGSAGADLSAAATAIGIPVPQLQQELATKSLNDVATAHGKNPADVATALKNAVHTRIDQDVTSGRLTASQATQAKQQVDQRIDQQMSQVGPPQGGPGGPGGGRGPGGPGGFGRNLSAAAQAIGIPVPQLQQELPGKSLSEVAQAHGKNAADVATALKNAAHQRLDQEVTSGRLTADQATQQKAQVDARIDQQMTELVPTAATGG